MKEKHDFCTNNKEKTDVFLLILFVAHMCAFVRTAEPTKEVLAAMKKFGYSGFREGQEEAVMRILCGNYVSNSCRKQYLAETKQFLTERCELKFLGLARFEKVEVRSLARGGFVNECASISIEQHGTKSF